MNKKYKWFPSFCIRSVIIKSFIVLITLSLTISKAFSQEHKLTGTVTDSAGKAVAGVSITIKGTQRGTATDENGFFELNVQPGQQLLISAVGFADQTVQVTTSTKSLQLTLLNEHKELEEVVVVGYGKQKKTDLTAAIAHVDGAALENRPVVNVAQALQGMVANLNISVGSAGGAPNAMQGINIRGYTGLGTAAGPLVVVDGIQGGDINSINPDDIESISVLKDAAASAIYGSSAPYGVILINTKRGKKNRQPVITYNDNFSFSQPLNLPHMGSSLEYAECFNEAFVNAGRSPWFDDETMQRIKDYLSGKITTETIKDPNNNAWYSWNKANANNDWFKIYFKDWAFNQQHRLGVSGGSENTTYYLGLGFNDKAGLYRYGNDDYKLYNVRANLTSDLKKWMTVGLRSSYSRSIYNTPNTYAGRTGGNYLHQIGRKAPTVPLFNPDGYYSEYSDIPLQEQGGRYIEQTDKLSLTGEIVLRPLKGWEITANYTFNGEYLQTSAHVKTINMMLPDGTTAPLGQTFPNAFSRGRNSTEKQIVNIFTSYEKRLDDHSFKVLAGFVNEYTDYLYYGASNTYLYSNDIPALNLTYGTSPTVADGIRRLGTRGYFGRLNYSFKDRYLVEFNGRYDGSSRFLDNHRWSFYPGVSAGWQISKEDFWSPLKDAVNNLKLRASYGALGDQIFIGEYNYYPFYPYLVTNRPTSTNWLFGSSQQASVYAPPLVNQDLTWVTTSTMNIGLDAAFLKNRLTASFDWYVRKSKDYAGPAKATPAVLGTNPPAVNNSAIETRGFELSLSWADQVSKDFSYSIKALLSDYRGKVTEYPNPTGILSSTWYKGMNLGEIWGYTSMGLFQSAEEIAKAPKQDYINKLWMPGDVRYKDINGDGKIDIGKNTVDSSGDLSVIGNSTPRYSYSFTLAANWKNFDINVFIQGVGKRETWMGSNYFFGITGDEWQSSYFTEMRDRWSPTNPNGYYPKYYMNSDNAKNQRVQSRYLQDVAYLRIKNLQIGYTLPQDVMRTIKLQRIRVYASVENLLTTTKMKVKSMDPEVFIGDGKIYPLQRTFSLGLNVTF
ncbi:TonB-dependent receptor [Danxiaibacter flavus]|uniref:TonB-dependent receptor n=1 Tax=Danxiaibacter flavus TaxID=3049108 RepID=A0ABV3ZMC9_9BACT|nr:TonB-dependent receptor [Chitinophagaceae bacterium DXS]